MATTANEAILSDAPLQRDPVARHNLSASRAVAILALIVAVSSTLTVAASHRMSATFDEIVLIAGGARGFETGRFDLAPDHPPLMQYIYGLPVYLSHANYPDESTHSAERVASPGYRYFYAREFFWKSGNDPERMAALGRWPAALIAALLVVLAYGFVSSRFGRPSGLLAAALTAFLPDVLAHGGVAYNDVPLSAAFLGAIWAADAAVRRPDIGRAALAGAAVALAICVKVSGIIILPVVGLIAVCEAVQRYREAAWWKSMAFATVIMLLSAYAIMVLVFPGDFGLERLRYAVLFQTRHAAQGHGANAFLLGERSATGWWYFFPVAFLLKTSAGLHFLILAAGVGIASRASRSWRLLLDSHLRGPVLGLIVFGTVLLASSLNIGFRYALPMLPLLVVIVAAGVTTFWSRARRQWIRGAVGVAVAWTLLFPATFYPNFLAFISEYGPGRDANHDVLVDSSLDWGQGLLELRRFLEEQGRPRIYLSYFGSAMPDGYGIDYAPMASFFTLAPPAVASTGRTPEWIVISATNLQGAYLTNDPFAPVRQVKPDHILAGGSLLVYRWTGN